MTAQRPTTFSQLCRRPDEVLPELRFVGLSREGQAMEARFPHRDGRIWTATIRTTLFQPSTLTLTLSTSGSIDYEFECPSLDGAKRTAHRFANMPMRDYMRLVATMRATTDHPTEGEACYVAVIPQSGEGEALVNLRCWREGRWDRDSGKLMLFPTAIELAVILGHVTAEDCRPAMLVAPAAVPAYIRDLLTIPSDEEAAPSRSSEQATTGELAAREERILEL